ncbi:esterase family protein [Phenylobacterium sp.]|uniref:alpha/beta hydrolase n=1 Tax=Phenylobacterium sp. TaxID=1871053 RepID=UPI002735DD11|nr:alpha/beta hydrolase-fold protein [Phenylobacterium sp.]MDP3855159.1 alpha/beta hydrolase-fold protein [Phenylobacterium sp.]
MLGLWLALCALPVLAQQSVPKIDAAPTCLETPTEVCRTGRRFPVQEAENRLKGEALAWWIENDTLNAVARRSGDYALLCCAVQTPMERIEGGVDLWAMSIRVPDLPHAQLTIGVFPTRQPMTRWRGPQAAKPASRTSIPADWIRDLTISSRAMGERRKLTIYAPPNPPPGRRYPVIYMADGDSVHGRAGIIHALVQDGKLPQVILVGLWPAPAETARDAGPGIQFRHQEYLIGFEGGDARFAAHERFLLEEVVPLAEREFAAATVPRQRAVTGYSNGGGWALQMGARHPDVFEKVISLSPGGASGIQRLHGARFGDVFLGGGTLEQGFGNNARTAAALAAPSARRLWLELRTAGHSEDLWEDLFAEATVRMFGDAGPPTAPESTPR